MKGKNTISEQVYNIIQESVVGEHGARKKSEIDIGKCYLVVVEGKIHRYYIVQIYTFTNDTPTKVTGTYLDLNTGYHGLGSFPIHCVNDEISRKQLRKAKVYFITQIKNLFNLVHKVTIKEVYEEKA